MNLQNPLYPNLEDCLTVLRDRASIGVVYSGNPDTPGSVIERTFNPRSWKSYREVAEEIADTLRSLGFKLVETVAEGIELQSAVASRRFNLFWLNTAGVQGRGPMSHAAGILESLGYPYIGHTPLQGALLDDKVLMKQWLRGVGLPTAPFIVRAGGLKSKVKVTDPDYAKEFGTTFKGPFIVKPALGRGSIDIKVVEDVSLLENVIGEITQRTEDRAVIESFLVGQEYCVWVSRGLKVKDNKIISRQDSLPFGHSERLFDLRRKVYFKDNADGRPADPSRPLLEDEEPLISDLSFVASKVLKSLGLFVPVRIDLRLCLDGLLSILEINPKPDLRKPSVRETSLLAVALADLDCSFSDFILKIVVDWLDYHIQFSPSSLAMLLPLFERYAPQASQKGVVHQSK